MDQHLIHAKLDRSLWFTNNHSEPRKTTAMTSFTVRVPDETAERLDRLAHK